jgi:hypothetical protein
MLVFDSGPQLATPQVSMSNSGYLIWLKEMIETIIGSNSFREIKLNTVSHLHLRFPHPGILMMDGKCWRKNTAFLLNVHRLVFYFIP